MKQIKLSILDRLKMHRLMWGWLSENPDKHKVDWFKKYPELENYEFCFLCKLFNSDCTKCSLYKADKNKDCMYYKSLFFYWKILDGEKRKRAAYKIAHCVDELIARCEYYEYINKEEVDTIIFKKILQRING